MICIDCNLAYNIYTMYRFHEHVLKMAKFAERRKHSKQVVWDENINYNLN
jgi:hypothetical protein